ncbi:MAG: hypothetical protein ABF629_07990 [Sporolactobacillus sp.]
MLKRLVQKGALTYPFSQQQIYPHIDLIRLMKRVRSSLFLSSFLTLFRDEK